MDQNAFLPRTSPTVHAIQDSFQGMGGDRSCDRNLYGDPHSSRVHHNLIDRLVRSLVTTRILPRLHPPRQFHRPEDWSPTKMKSNLARTKVNTCREGLIILRVSGSFY